MKFTLALVAAIAGSAIARPTTLADRVKSRRDGNTRHKSHPNIKVGSATKENVKFIEGESNSTAHVQYSSNWSGAVLEQPTSGYFTSATGRFNVVTPTYAGDSDSESASAWVGIDGDSCASGLLQGGIDFTVDSSGDVSYDAWYEWYPDYAYDFNNFDVNSGDIIQVDITATSTTRGTVRLTNTSTGKSVSKTLNAPSGSTLCRQNAEWIVEDFESGNSQVALSNFGTVTFTSASASLSGGGKDDLSTATILDLKMGGTVYTDVTIDSSSQVSVKYI
ncbi:hypothetical protein ACJQWK_08669 [Exserohilum turcicum]|uniref:Acid protease n=1 Tax=Exserohilum turcicum (strain 28A) TaxID=671987 RepID=R0KIQ7_EXST2|nr:uncharacterized protein SETTUDRAFT_27866 [Exserohilum turcica Et28A]EOA87927.1 hypothetical protein SETTUDRAFT_27866 [Exserohilum turcica Et28A]